MSWEIVLAVVTGYFFGQFFTIRVSRRERPAQTQQIGTLTDHKLDFEELNNAFKKGKK